jgi:hypothetical protein
MSSVPDMRLAKKTLGLCWRLLKTMHVLSGFLLQVQPVMYRLT